MSPKWLFIFLIGAQFSFSNTVKSDLTEEQTIQYLKRFSQQLGKSTERTKISQKKECGTELKGLSISILGNTVSFKDYKYLVHKSGIALEEIGSGKYLAAKYYSVEGVEWDHIDYFDVDDLGGGKLFFQVIFHKPLSCREYFFNVQKSEVRTTRGSSCTSFRVRLNRYDPQVFKSVKALNHLLELKTGKKVVSRDSF